MKRRHMGRMDGDRGGRGGEERKMMGFEDISERGRKNPHQRAALYGNKNRQRENCQPKQQE